MLPEAPRGYYIDAALSTSADLLDVDMETLLTGGYRIYTALDPALQARCEAVFADDSFFPASDCEGAIAVQQAETGYVTAMVGGRESDVAMAFNRATRIRRQPGSVIKPIIAYAPALELCGYTAASMLLDEPTTFADYTPSNFNGKYYGWVTMREAVQRSLNVPAVKVLSEVGLGQGKAFAESLGISFDEADTSLTLALGGFTYGVSPWQLAGAYAAFASGGVYDTPTVVRCITDAQGRVLYEYEPEAKRVMREENTYILTSMLESAIEEGTGRRLGELDIPLAGKTGTVGVDSGNRDAWMAAYNPEYAACVWIGYDNASDGMLPADATGRQISGVNSAGSVFLLVRGKAGAGLYHAGRRCRIYVGQAYPFCGTYGGACKFVYAGRQYIARSVPHRYRAKGNNAILECPGSGTRFNGDPFQCADPNGFLYSTAVPRPV